MFRQAAVVAVATVSALAAAHAMTRVTQTQASPAQASQAQASQAQATEAAVLTPVAGPAELTKASDGHFWAEAEVDGRWVRLLVDTGASSVALTPQDAQRLGVDLASLQYDRPVATANGETQAAAVLLDHVAVAGARVDQVPALVVRQGLATSLLGMSYLGRLSRFEATPTALILRP